jgi:hypothetical protein
VKLKPPLSVHRWALDTPVVVTATDPHTERRTKVLVSEVRITVDTHEGYIVSLDGNNVRANGTAGQHPRSHYYVERWRPHLPSLTLADLPDWAGPYLTYARALHAPTLTESDIARALYAKNPADQPWNGEPYGYAERGAEDKRKLAHRQARAVLTLNGRAR